MWSGFLVLWIEVGFFSRSSYHAYMQCTLAVLLLYLVAFHDLFIFWFFRFSSHVISYPSSVVWFVGGPKAACAGCAGFAAFSVLIEKFLDRHD